MQANKDTQFETPISTSWLDEKGWLYSQSKNTADRIENIQTHFKILDEQLKIKPVCFIVYPKFKQSIPMECRVFLKEQYPHYFKAVAHITDNKMMAMGIDFILRIRPRVVPM